MRTFIGTLILAALLGSCAGHAIKGAVERQRDALDAAGPWQATDDPCWSDEYQRVLPPLYGTDC